MTLPFSRVPKLLWRALLLVLPATLSAQSSGQTSASEDQPLVLSAFTVSTSQDQGYRAGNSVSATRIDTAIKNLPFSINAFTEQFIEDTGARDLQDIVKYAPGVTGAGREFVSGNTRFNIRGFDTSSPQRNGFVGARYVDPVNIQRVEVVKGPASLLYGAIEPGGTVNYITKKPFAQRSIRLSQDVGTYEFSRTTLDVNLPIVGGKLLSRVNALFENGPNPGDFTGDRRWVIAPSVTWVISQDHSLTVDYEHYDREERTPFNTLPNIVVVSHNVASAANAANPTAVVRLTDPVATTFDYGLLTPFPLPKNFNWTGVDDWRTATNDNLNAEYVGKLTDQWTLRANAAYQKNEIRNKATGIGDINTYAPGTANSNGTIDPATVPGTTAAEKNTYLLGLARQFAARVLANPDAVWESPYIFQARRKRLTTDEFEARSYQAELAGNYVFDFGTLKPLVGAFLQKNTGSSLNRQSTANPPAGVANEATTPTQNLQPWSYLNLGNRTLNESYDENVLPLQANATSSSQNEAFYAVLNASFLQERLFAVAGVRRSEVEASSFNLITNIAGTDFSVSNTSKQFGAGYKALPSLLVFGSYAESFTPANTLLSFNGVPSGPGKPITSDGLEFGIKTDFLSGRVSSTISYFEINQLDRISRFSIPDPVTGTTLSSVIQGTKDKSSGLELEVTLSPTDHWQVYLSYSHINARTVGVPTALAQALGKKIENSAEHLFNAWTRYNLTGDRWNGFWVGGGVNYTGKKKLSISNPDLFYEPVTLWDATIGYDWKRGKTAWSATLTWKNITDEVYLTGLIGRGLPERVWLSLSLKL
ncbi:MAG TPA: TonB-dependent receptor [Opitutaceae bacterium]|nr:TonB-dependent receptor [Opitutaceae bacterium]